MFNRHINPCRNNNENICGELLELKYEEGQQCIFFGNTPLITYDTESIFIAPNLIAYRASNHPRRAFADNQENRAIFADIRRMENLAFELLARTASAAIGGSDVDIETDLTFIDNGVYTNINRVFFEIDYKSLLLKIGVFGCHLNLREHAPEMAELIEETRGRGDEFKAIVGRFLRLVYTDILNIPNMLNLNVRRQKRVC